MTLRAKARDAALAIAPEHAYRPLVAKYANLASDVWEPVVQAFLDSPQAKYHNQPRYGKEFFCPTCDVGLECRFAAAIKTARESYRE